MPCPSPLPPVWLFNMWMSSKGWQFRPGQASVVSLQRPGSGSLVSNKPPMTSHLAGRRLPLSPAEESQVLISLDINAWFSPEGSQAFLGLSALRPARDGSSEHPLGGGSGRGTPPIVTELREERAGWGVPGSPGHTDTGPWPGSLGQLCPAGRTGHTGD